MPGDERQHDRCLIIGIEVRPVHGDLNTLPRAQHVRNPAHKRFSHINPRVRQQPVHLFNRMFAQSSPRQSQSMSNGADGQGSTGHHAKRRVCQGVNPYRMHIFGKQSADEIEGVFEFGFSIASGHRFLPPPDIGGEDSYSFNLYSIVFRISCTYFHLIRGFRFFSQKNSASMSLLLPVSSKNEGNLEGFQMLWWPLSRRGLSRNRGG